MDKNDAMVRYRRCLHQEGPAPPADVVAQVVASLDLDTEKIKADIATVRRYREAQRVRVGLADIKHELASARKVYLDLNRQLATRTLCDQSSASMTLDAGLEGQVTTARNRVAQLENKVRVAQEAGEELAAIEEEFPELLQTQRANP